MTEVLQLEKQLWISISSGKLGRVHELLFGNLGRSIDVNFGNPAFVLFTPLHIACFQGSLDVVVLLLSHPDIDVNSRDANGHTPFSIACECREVEVVKVLLNDPRVDVNLPDFNSATPLWWCANKGHIDIIKLLIASGRQLHCDSRAIQHWHHPNTNPIEVARVRKKKDVVELLERFMVAPLDVVHEARSGMEYKGCNEKELFFVSSFPILRLLCVYIFLDALAANLFALIVLYCDKYLDIHLEALPASSRSTVRFFVIAAQLPMDLQMVMCNRAHDLSRNVISTSVSELALRMLARSFPMEKTSPRRDTAQAAVTTNREKSSPKCTVM
jgi:hypothetical protein